MLLISQCVLLSQFMPSLILAGAYPSQSLKRTVLKRELQLLDLDENGLQYKHTNLPHHRLNCRGDNNNRDEITLSQSTLSYRGLLYA